MLDHPSASRQHATLVLNAQGPVITDCGSAHGMKRPLCAALRQVPDEGSLSSAITCDSTYQKDIADLMFLTVIQNDASLCCPSPGLS